MALAHAAEHERVALAQAVSQARAHLRPFVCELVLQNFRFQLLQSELRSTEGSFHEDLQVLQERLIRMTWRNNVVAREMSMALGQRD